MVALDNMTHNHNMRMQGIARSKNITRQPKPTLHFQIPSSNLFETPGCENGIPNWVVGVQVLTNWYPDTLE